MRRATMPAAGCEVSKAPPAVPQVLCIDDDVDLLRALQLQLSRFDVKFIPAFYGTHGIWLAITRQPDVVITDLRMPHGDGDYVVQLLQRNRATAKIPVIVLTGVRGDELSGHLQRLGAASVLFKPMQFESVRRELSKFIELHDRTGRNLPN